MALACPSPPSGLRLWRLLHHLLVHALPRLPGGTRARPPGLVKGWAAWRCVGRGAGQGLGRMEVHDVRLPELSGWVAFSGRVEERVCTGRGRGGVSIRPLLPPPLPTPAGCNTRGQASSARAGCTCPWAVEWLGWPTGCMGVWWVCGAVGPCMYADACVLWYARMHTRTHTHRPCCTPAPSPSHTPIHQPISPPVGSLGVSVQLTRLLSISVSDGSVPQWVRFKL